MELTANNFAGAEAPITFYDMEQVSLVSTSATSNVGNSLFKIYYKSPVAFVRVTGGSFESNTV